MSECRERVSPEIFQAMMDVCQQLSPKFLLLVLVGVAVADKRPVVGSYSAPPSSAEYAEIVKDDRVHPTAEGYYTLDMETENGIRRQESGSEGGNQQGSYSYTAPDGTPVHVTFVADEFGFQPQSDLLPVAPEFPHPIPQFVLDQIKKAEEEDRGTSYEVPSGRYTYA
ncbi:hypothetical protein Pmani_002993 [Petrolisthes manimaculis]|uniref:Uncharacterized protein n=1 Tax=Petrolisthes manimaculis TaxID=1843537 RepID=A0AAE1QJB5_9EUCA|nr:hypothetical protein Pmani_002993 [Petrolisthes manimaculis]